MAKPGPKPVKLADGKGLYLLVNPGGSKLRRCKYRVLRREKILSLGAYPDVSLAQAREGVDKARKLLAAGADPMAIRKADKLASWSAAENLFESVARAWWLQWTQGRSEQHAGQVMRRFEANVFPHIGARPVSEVQAPELVTMRKVIEARGVNDLAKRALQTSNQVFRDATSHGEATRNPAADIRPSDVLASRQKQNLARIDGKELPALLRHIEAYTGAATTRLAMKLMAMIFVRTTELIARSGQYSTSTRRAGTFRPTA